MTSMSAAAELMIFGPQTALFKHYGNYYSTRYTEDSHKPLAEPITEFREVLVLLYDGLNDSTQRCLDMNATLPDGSWGPAIQIQIFNGGYGRCELSGEHIFPVSPEVVEELKKEELLSGTPHIGYTDMNKLRLNDRAIDRIIVEANKFKKESETTMS